MTLTEADVPGVDAALERYRAAREELDSAAEAQIAALQAQVALRRKQRRG